MPTFFNLNLLKKLTHWPIIQKVHYFYYFKFNCSINIQFQILFHLPTLFSPFPHGTFLHYRWIKILGLEDGSPIFKQNFTCFGLLYLHLNIFNLQDFHLILQWNHHLKLFKKYFLDYPILCSFTTTYKIFFNFFILVTKMFQFTKFILLVFFKKIISYNISIILF